MDDEADETPDPHADPASEAHIRALLAELGSDPDGQLMPPQVAARLDDTLARLVAERANAVEEHEDPAGTVVPLRRRWARRATLAAAAVVVLGAGGVAAANLGVLGDGPSVSFDSGDSAGGQAESAQDAPTTPTPSGKARATTRGAAGLPQISAGAFASEVTSLLQRGTPLVTPDELPPTDAGGDPGESPGRETPEGATDSLRVRDCPGPGITDGGVPNAVLYDGQLAVLVVHPERDGRQLVEAWNCAGDRRLAGTTVTP
jgi:hypothetical protein